MKEGCNVKQFQICTTSITNAAWSKITIEANELIIIDKNTIAADGVRVVFSDNIVEVSENGNIIYY